MDRNTERKSDLVRRMVAEGNFKAALRIASDFDLGITKEDKVDMKRGYECMLYSGFYESIGVNVHKSIDKGIQTVKRLYGTNP